MARRITKANISFLSLVPRGANRLPVLYKADDHTLDIEMLVKESPNFADKGELLAVVYAPEMRDSQGDIASAEVIKDAAYEFARAGKGIDLRHDGVSLPKDKAFVAEQFIVQKGDARFADMKDYAGKAVDVTGAWAAVLKIEDPALRTLYRDGKWNGVSMGGTGEVREEVAKGGKKKFLKMLVKALCLGGNIETESDMTPAELTAELDKRDTSLLTKIDALVKGAPAKEPPPVVKAPDAPIFKGDPWKIADVLKHQEALRRHELAKGVNWADPASVAAYSEALAKEAPTTPAESDELKAAKARVAELEKASGQAPGNPPPSHTGNTGHVGLTKSDNDLAEQGRKAAMAYNQSRGFKA